MGREEARDEGGGAREMKRCCCSLFSSLMRRERGRRRGEGDRADENALKRSILARRVGTLCFVLYRRGG